jgi:preprotein translocase subunit SecY
MEKQEILEKAKSKKVYVGEMEKQKMGKGNWISLIIAGIVATALIVAEFAQRRSTGGFAVAGVCYAWASSQYFCQYFLAKRPWQVLIGAVLDALAFVACIVFYILFSVKGW